MSRPLSTDEIWREFSGRLRGYIGAQVRRPEDAEDILQEVFIRIHEKLDTLRSTERLAPWLYALARNAVIDHLRRRRGTEPLADAPEPAAVEEAGNINTLVASWLEPVLQQMPADYRTAVEAVELAGESQASMAQRLGLSGSGAKSRVQRGRKMLREKILDCCHLELDRRGILKFLDPVVDLRPPDERYEKFVPDVVRQSGHGGHPLAASHRHNLQVRLQVWGDFGVFGKKSGVGGCGRTHRPILAQFLA